MSERRPSRGNRSPRPGALAVVLVLAAMGWLASAPPASAEPVAWAFPQDSAAGEAMPCLPTDVFCVAGEAAGAVVADVWISAMLALWGAGLWLLGLAFSVVDALATPDLSANGPLAAVYPVTFGIGATVAAGMALVQLGVAAVRRDGQSLGRLLIGLVQFGLVWAGYVGVAALLVTGVSGLTTGLLRSLLGIDTLAAFDPSISVARDLVDGTVATVLGVSAVFLLVPASVGYLLLMMVREAALIVLAATSAISAGGLLAQSSSAWFWRSLRWFLAALLVAPVAVLVLGVGVTITEGVITGAKETSTEAAVGMAVVGCLLILLGAVCPLALFRLLAFVDPGTSSGAALRQSLAGSGGVLGALEKRGGGRSAGAAATVGAASGGVAASGAAAQLAGDRAQGESTADAATDSRFAGALRALSVGSTQAGRLAAAAAVSAADVLSGAGIGHTAPYYGQSVRGRAPVGGTGHAAGTSASPRSGEPPHSGDDGRSAAALAPDPLWSPADRNDDPSAAGRPPEPTDGGAHGERVDGNPPAPRSPRGDPSADGDDR
jgi:type IV secretion system protein TrbL